MASDFNRCNKLKHLEPFWAQKRDKCNKDLIDVIAEMIICMGIVCRKVF